MVRSRTRSIMAWWPYLICALKKMNCSADLLTIIREYIRRCRVGDWEICQDVTQGCPQGISNILFDGLIRIKLPLDCSTVASVDVAALLVRGNSRAGLEIR